MKKKQICLFNEKIFPLLSDIYQNSNLNKEIRTEIITTGISFKQLNRLNDNVSCQRHNKSFKRDICCFSEGYDKSFKRNILALIFVLILLFQFLS